MVLTAASTFLTSSPRSLVWACNSTLRNRQVNIVWVGVGVGVGLAVVCGVCVCVCVCVFVCVCS